MSKTMKAKDQRQVILSWAMGSYEQATEVKFRKEEQLCLQETKRNMAQ